jgi:hypothetical protein
MAVYGHVPPPLRISLMRDDSNTDDSGQAVSIVLEDERYEANVSHLETCLRKGFTAMAAVLEQDERVKKDIASLV